LTGDRESAGRRQRRVGEGVRAELSRLLSREVRDARLAWATITSVEMSPDLRNARVYFVDSGSGDQDRMGRSLERAAPFLQREIGQKLKLRFTPRLSFYPDESFDEASRVDELIERAAAEDAERRADDSPERRLARLVSDAGRILVATHANPDGDAVGSLLGLSRVLRLMGKEALAYCPDGIPGTLRFLPGADEVATAIDDRDRFELTIVVDTAAANLLPDGFPEAERRGKLVVIDHHAQHGDLGDLVIRRDSSAVGELLYDLAQELVWPIDEQVALCLYASIVADTGSFRYASTTHHTHEVAAALMSLGAEPWQVATALYESYPLRRQRLLAEVLSTLETCCDGRYADLVATQETLARAGATKADLDGMINFGRAIDGVEISAMFRREPGGEIKVSFRSKGRIDVGGLASTMGGGGHVNAAGCTLTDIDIDGAKAKIRAAVADLLARYDRGEEPRDE
jgi:phosphoesterase RecJ-like protein